MHRIPAIALLASLTACAAPSRDEFTDRYVEALCATTIRCQSMDDDENVYDDQAECEAALKSSGEASEHANCDYDPECASDCLDAVYDLGCQPTDDRYEALGVCDEVWSCPDEGDDTGEDDGG